MTMVLEEIYEQDFLSCSYGFRPGRSAHQALRTLQNVLWARASLLGARYRHTQVLRFRTFTFARFLTNESRTASSEGGSING